MIALIVTTLLAADAGIVVLDVDSTALDAEVAKAVQSRVAGGVAGAVDDVEVATTADLRALADVAATQQALDCDGSSSCLAELADAYGAATVVTTRVSQVAGLYAVEVVRLDAHTARVLRRVDGQSDRRGLLALAKQLGGEVVSDEDGGGGLFAGGVVTGVIGAVALVGGGVGAVRAHGAVSGRGVSAADKNLGFQTRLPLLAVAGAGAVVTVAGVVLVVVGAAE
jgi:hypothetical protein